MKIVSALLIVIGLAIAVLMPRTVTNSDFEEIATIDMSDLASAGSAEAVFELALADSLVRLQLQAEPDKTIDPGVSRVEVIAKLSDKQGTLLAGVISFNLEEASGAATLDGSQPIDFDVKNEGAHALTLTFADDEISRLPELGKVSAVFYRNIEDIGLGFAIMGYPLALLGLYLFIRFRKKKPPEEPQWGRGE